MHQHLSMGFVIKVHAVYDRPFWREQGLSGTAFSPYELSHEAYDNTNHGDERGTLVGFVSDQRADDMFRAVGRGAQGAHPRVAVALLRPRGEEPGRVLRKRLGQRGVDPRRVRRELRPRRPRTATARTCATPSGRSSFACSDLAGAGYQHVDGAIRMGRLVASQIVEEARA